MTEKTILKLAGTRLREERTRHNLSLDAAARELGLSHRSQLSRIERGEQSLDSILLRRAAALFGVPMDAFFSERASGGLLVKARQGEADVAAAQEMADWAQRKLGELRYVMREVHDRGL